MGTCPGGVACSAAHSAGQSYAARSSAVAHCSARARASWMNSVQAPSAAQRLGPNLSPMSRTSRTPLLQALTARKRALARIPAERPPRAYPTASPAQRATPLQEAPPRHCRAVLSQGLLRTRALFRRTPERPREPAAVRGLQVQTWEPAPALVRSNPPPAVPRRPRPPPAYRLRHQQRPLRPSARPAPFNW
jgi:hypothetical protein